ncbi:hypothetical protein [Sphingobacterium kitahiroshimense]|uniref:hypothetical protein n=1 Tax=Sphingobacterium kitahiroshimense TaxID=470446 RepID=UPI003208EED8
MKVNAISDGLNHTLKNDIIFATILIKVIVPNLEKLCKQIPDFDDYCVFIKIEHDNKSCKIKFHDGGAKYDKDLDALVHITYGEVICFLNVKEESTLYYSVDEGILCYLDER